MELYLYMRAAFRYDNIHSHHFHFSFFVCAVLVINTFLILLHRSRLSTFYSTYFCVVVYFVSIH